MALEEIPLPIRGVNYSIPEDKTPGTYSPYMLNVRPFDTLENKIRLGKRPGLDKIYSQQIATLSGPVIEICSVSVVN